jgi:hypothetical protein
LPVGQQQVLDRIEIDLESCEPKLRSMFAIFTRLTRDDGAPRTESLGPEGRRSWCRWWTGPRPRPARPRRALAAVSLLLGLVVLLVVMVLNSSAARGCLPAAGPHITATHIPGCTTVLGSSGR